MPAEPTTTYPNVLHATSAPDVLWTRVNAEEATPGVLTPLHWDFYGDHCERGLRLGMFDRGVYSEDEVEPPSDVSQRWSALFFGRVTLNVDALRACYDRIPGASGDDFERSMLGSVRPDAVSGVTDARYGIIREKSERLARELPDRIHSTAARFHGWWSDAVADGVLDEPGAAAAAWREAQERLEEGMRLHSAATHFTVESFTETAGWCARAERLDLLNALAGGYGDTEDDEVASGLWELARGRGDRRAFVADYGFRGHREGDLAARVWREDGAALDAVLEGLARLGEDQRPEVTAIRRREERETAERALAAAVGADEAGEVRRVLDDLHRFTVLRELGKATFLRAVDVGRAASRALGRHHTAAGRLDDPEDVFLLLGSELFPVLAADARERIAERRALRAHYEGLDVPQTWVGNPVAQPSPTASAAPTGAVSGLGASGGVVEGVVRVVHDPATDEPLSPGEILVCRTTDPSWVGHFMVAGALVIDVGGPLSHGAIVARELGVPCVIGTGDGTARLVSGSLVRVDGDRGTVEVLAAAVD